MTPVNLSEFFKNYINNSELLAAVNGGELTDISADTDERAMDISVHFREFVPLNVLSAFCREVKRFFGILKLNFSYDFEPSCFTSEAYPSIVRELKAAIPASNGFFDGAEMKAEDGVFRVYLSHGGAEILKNAGAEEKLSSIIKNRFGLSFTTEINDSYVIAADSPEYIEMQGEVKKVAPPAAPEKKPRKKTSRSFEGLPISIENEKPLYGNAIKVRPEPIKTVTPESGVVVVWGDVFGLDINDGIKGGKFVKIKFFLTDYTGSCSAELFLKGEDHPDELISNLKNGMTVLVRGEMAFNDFSKEYGLKIKAVSKIDKIEETDNAEKKRVELHLHTNMSAMDGVSSAEKLIKRAIKWGHKAIAITDHGVVQAFPEAVNAAQKDIKVIFGMEGYFVDDMMPVVNGDADILLSGDFTVFDIETTGLSKQYDRITEIGALHVRD
ncbi:MAG: PHP domain-containing protein, partial [Clostridiales bacterium]|nr:PHP domain-containing protein [Clostridiales bacterium]